MDTRAINCPNCNRLISRSEPVCPICGANRTGWSTARTLQKWIAEHGVTNALLVANVVMFFVALALSGHDGIALRGNLFTFLGPRMEASGFLGLLDPDAVMHDGEIWRLLTCAFLHVGLLHILFNLSWLRSIGPVLEEEFGSIRFACVYIGAALCGSVACLAFKQGGLGASGAVFGLIGAGWSHGKRRGGVWGAEVRSQFSRWAISGVLFTLLMSKSVSVPGHFGGLLGGAALGWLLSPPQRRWTTAHRDPPWLTLLGGSLLAAVPLAFAADVTFGLLAPSRVSIPFLIGGMDNLEQWPLRSIELAQIGAPGWMIDVPRGWDGQPSGFGGALVFDGSVGVNLSIEVYDGALLPHDLSKLLRWAEGGSSDFTESHTDLAAGFASAERAGPTGITQFINVRRLGAKQVLLVRSSARSEIDAGACRELCARVADSVKRSPEPDRAGK
jgi:rhomboid protease GluP